MIVQTLLYFKRKKKKKKNPHTCNNNSALDSRSLWIAKSFAENGSALREGKLAEISAQGT